VLKENFSLPKLDKGKDEDDKEANELLKDCSKVLKEFVAIRHIMLEKLAYHTPALHRTRKSIDKDGLKDERGALSDDVRREMR
jgi:hypothetical protein